MKKRKKKKEKRTLDGIGKIRYNFDFQLERTIYCYLCCCRVKRSERNILPEEWKFIFYRQWKDYIWNKYKEYRETDLMEFSRYLNQCMRNIKPEHEYENIIAAVIMTVGVTKSYEFILTPSIDLRSVSNIGKMIVVASLAMFVCLLIGYLVFYTLLPLFNNNIDENFLRDYKEIIDEIIKEKSKDSV